MTARFPDKDPEEQVVLLFDFGREAAAVSSPQVTCDVQWSASPAPAADVRSGAPQVSGDHPAQVLQTVAGGTDWTDYALRCKATGPDGQVLVVGAVLPVRRRPARS